MESYPFLAWIEKFVILLLGAGVSAKIVEMYLSRKFKKSDESDEVHATNQGKQIETESEYRMTVFADFRKEINDLRAQVQTLNDKYNSQFEMSAELKAENKILKEKEQTQEKEINSLKSEIEKISKENINLKSRLNKAQEDIDYYQREFNLLKAEFNNFKK